MISLLRLALPYLNNGLIYVAFFAVGWYFISLRDELVETKKELTTLEAKAQSALKSYESIIIRLDELNRHRVRLNRDLNEAKKLIEKGGENEACINSANFIIKRMRQRDTDQATPTP